MLEDSTKPKRKAKHEDGPEKKPRFETASIAFEVQPEVENFQREALWRSLQDYKRRSNSSQEQLEKLQQSAQYHDEHLRIVDVWWDQLLDEIGMISHKELPQEEQDNDNCGTHFFETIPELSVHLGRKRQKIMNSVLYAFQKVKVQPRSDESITNLESTNAVLCAQLRLANLEIEKLKATQAEREPKILDLQERLASSQRKVDRQKSITLARIEAQARKAPQDILNAASIATAKMEDSCTNGLIKSETIEDNNHLAGQASEDVSDRDAGSEQLQKQVIKLNIEVAELKTRETAMYFRLNHLALEDIEKSVPYRLMVVTNEQLTNRIDTLMMLNSDIAQELLTLKSERTNFQETLAEEYDDQHKEMAHQLAKAEHDLARVRSARDELHASLQTRKAQDDNKSNSAREIGELADTQGTRINALEAEIERLKQDLLGYAESSIHQSSTNGRQNEEFAEPQLHAKLEKLQKENESLKHELPTMEKAFNQAHEQNLRKVMELVSSEDKIARLQAEKSKADSKYFAAMKVKEQLALELKTVKVQNMKASEAISKLQEAGDGARQQIQALERQIAAIGKIRDKYKFDIKRTEDDLTLSKLQLEQNQTKTTDALNRAATKDFELAQETNKYSAKSDELEAVRKQYNEIKDLAQTSAVISDSSAQVQVYRGIAMCSVCNIRWKDTALASCGHVFCKECVDKRVETRQRRCPNCNKGVS